MESEIGWFSRMLISLGLTASLLALGGVLGYAGRGVLVDIDNKRVTTQVIQQQREILSYENIYVTADDVYLAVIRYNRVLPLSIQYYSGSSKVYLNLTPDSNATMWTKDYLRPYLTDTLYRARLSRGMANEVTGVVFDLVN